MVLLCVPMPETQPAATRPAADLLQAIGRDRSKAAFAQLFRLYAPRLRGWFVNGGIGAQADELTQEVMLRVWRKADRYDPGRASVSTWIFAIARNARIDHLRKRRIEVDESDPALVPADQDDVDQALDVHREARALRDAIDELPEPQSLVVRAAYFEHKTLAVIASEQQIPLGTVKSRVRLAFTALRRALGSAS